MQRFWGFLVALALVAPAASGCQAMIARDAFEAGSSPAIPGVPFRTSIEQERPFPAARLIGKFYGGIGRHWFNFLVLAALLPDAVVSVATDIVILPIDLLALSVKEPIEEKPTKKKAPRGDDAPERAPGAEGR